MLSILEETLKLRQVLAAQAVIPEWDFLARHDLLSKKPPRSFGDRIFRLTRDFLASVRLLPPRVTKYSWRPLLKHAFLVEDAKTLLIWAPGVGRDELRYACEGFLNRLNNIPSLAPVLVTDVADFAYFSRLKWLVEYLPELSGEGLSYRERKQRYLAWRYRDALIVPASAGWASDKEWDALLKASLN